MRAIVDCNSFYCSCERLFRPEFENKPVVVLSNNDGCIIARTDEAKEVGFSMATPYYMVSDIIKKNGVGVFSSNYNFYGDMSRRVMETLKHVVGEDIVEVYSIDEAFLDLTSFKNSDLNSLAFQLRTTVEKWTGIQVSIGIAPTKTLAKIANKIAKNNKEKSGCINVLDSPRKIAAALKSIPIDELWGVGARYAEKLKELGIDTGWDLYNVSEEFARKHLGGVVGVRLIKELHGEEGLIMEKPLITTKMISTTRRFGRTVTELEEIKEAVAAYTSRTAEKLRRQHCAASIINVFIIANEEKKTYPYKPGDTFSTQIVLPSPTALTNELIKSSLSLTEKIFIPGRKYSKAGVIISGLVPDTSIQANLFNAPSKNAGRYLMDMVDNINFGIRKDMVKFASSGVDRSWKMRQEFLSPRYTTRWDELCKVH
ncbi:MAG TPA: Y-family DNA polymerase [Flavisolibacter sp.]|nr:Y-family DNA polymerase [Flavisolibacter sp.]